MDIDEAFEVIRNFSYFSDQDEMINELKRNLDSYLQDGSSYSKNNAYRWNLMKSLKVIKILVDNNTALVKLIYPEEIFIQYKTAMETIEDYITSIDVMKKISK